jgi:sugar-specific transcriptional regulator TrmB
MIIDERILEVFGSVGIPKMQTIVYLDLLKNKESTATQISKRTRMHRANVYDNLTKLRERNLVYSLNRDGRNLFLALSTDLIINEEKERLENLKLTMEHLRIAYAHGHTPSIYTLEGSSALKSILFALLNKKSDVWIYGIAEDEGILNILNDRLMHPFHIERIKNQIKFKLFFYKSPARGVGSINNSKFTEARLLSKARQSEVSKVTQIVCGGSVYITLWAHPIYTIVIDSKEVAEEYLDLYNIIWGHSKEL